jgi:ABC-type ATPase involved in cell division
MSQVLLAFENVQTAGDGRHRSACASGITFEACAGDVILVHADQESEDLPLLDLAIGLMEPDAGHIRFCGEDWASMAYAKQLGSRHRIGTLAKEQVWLSNQTVMRNVLLGLRHHTTRTDVDLEAEADALAKIVGLGEIPRVRPAVVPPRRLRMAGWVRAFVGLPELVVLIFPEQDALAAWPGMLNGLLESARERGAAALVVSDSEALWGLPVMAGARHFCVQDGVWESC